MIPPNMGKHDGEHSVMAQDCTLIAMGLSQAEWQCTTHFDRDHNSNYNYHPE
jgi:hypothetical protein